eukprot:gene16023-21749_t
MKHNHSVLKIEHFKQIVLDNIKHNVENQPSVHGFASSTSYQLNEVNNTPSLIKTKRNSKKSVGKEFLRVFPSVSHCKKRYSQRSYRNESDWRLPPMLYTFPGSGNTWCRMLIEYTTGIYSGSVYTDSTLLEALPGEISCSLNVSVVKVHPTTHSFESLRLGNFPSDDNYKCNRGGIKEFRRAILLLRNPYDSIWSEYQRRVTESHVKCIKKESFDWHRWQANAAALSNNYYDMWHIHYVNITKFFHPNNVLYLKYEDLKRKATRIHALRKVANFLEVNFSNSFVDRERLECAFILGESEKAHRSVAPEEKELFMTKDISYQYQELVCRMWSKFGVYAVRFGYMPWANMNCSSKSYAPIETVAVGLNGEYDLKWVKPGEKLIDYRNSSS